jgi:TRAP-type mannitol/chloroaromatic compound transport system substrate-binding protein
MVSSFPRSLDTLFGACERVAARVSEMTEGAFELKVYPAGELVPGLQVLDAVQSSSVECGQTAAYYYVGKNPVLAFDACVPFDMTARQKSAWLLEGGGGELLDKAWADFGVLSIPAGNTGAQMGGWFKEAVPSLASLGGRKMRIPGLGGSVMSQLGVSVQNIAGGDIFPALERGAIDATEWVGPHDDEKLGFFKVAPHYCYPGWWEPGPNLSMLVNRKAWEALPSSYRHIFRAACLEVSGWMLARYDALNPAALERLLAQGVQLAPFPEDLMVAARQASEALLQDSADKDPAYRAVFEHWSAFRAASRRWESGPELSYARFVSEAR